MKEHLPQQDTATSVGLWAWGAERLNPQGLMLNVVKPPRKEVRVPRAPHTASVSRSRSPPSGQKRNCTSLPPSMQ